MLDPIISLAFLVQSNKGIYALLLGSGVSRAAGIPTGWEVVLDMIHKVAYLQGEDCEPDPAKWYRTKFGADPDYARLLNAIAGSPAERAYLLRSYFEPNQEEREQGLKAPTEAHKAIAELVAAGHIRIIITTNFDRLLEQALESVGVTPTVISTADAAEGALPLTHTTCSIIKVHGDYLDTRIKNTPLELAEFDGRICALLDRIFDEFGLIICGWSAEWDTALRAALERCKTHRFTTYWASVGDPGQAAQRLITLRSAQLVQIRDADTFFRELAEKVAALEEYAYPHPLSTKAAIARVKRYLSEERYRIRLQDLVAEETEMVYATLSDANFPVQGVSFSAEELQRRLARYEASLETLVALLTIGCYWGKREDAGLWVKVLERIGNPPGSRSGLTVWLGLRLYPALLTFYASGLAAIAAGNYSTFAALLTTPMYHEESERVPLALKLAPTAVVNPDAMKQVQGKQYYTPISEYLFELLRKPLRQFLPDDRGYDRTFDRFEYLFALAYADLMENAKRRVWGPVGRFGWKWRDDPEHHVSQELAEEAAREANHWQPLRAGLFGGSLERFQSIKNQFDSLVAQLPWH